MLQVSFHPLGEVDDFGLKYAVIVSRYKDQWVLCRHRDRTTWEIPGGHREPSETIEETAARELYEETGSIQQKLHRITDYSVTRTTVDSEPVTTYGALFFAEIQELGSLDPALEIAEIGYFSCLPEEDQLTYPLIQPQLHIKAQVWLNTQSNADELWDVYDENGCFTGRTHRRGDSLKRGEYHLVVHVWLQNPEGKLLITKRAPNKGFPNMWECTGGSALAGDDSLTAAIREVREETGLTVLPEQGRRIYRFQRPDNFTDVWLFTTDAPLCDVVLQEGETTEARYVTVGEIMDMLHQGIFVPFYYLENLADLISGTSGVLAEDMVNYTHKTQSV